MPTAFCRDILARLHTQSMRPSQSISKNRYPYCSLTASVGIERTRRFGLYVLIPLCIRLLRRGERIIRSLQIKKSVDLLLSIAVRECGIFGTIYYLPVTLKKGGIFSFPRPTTTEARYNNIRLKIVPTNGYICFS